MHVRRRLRRWFFLVLLLPFGRIEFFWSNSALDLLSVEDLAGQPEIQLYLEWLHSVLWVCALLAHTPVRLDVIRCHPGWLRVGHGLCRRRRYVRGLAVAGWMGSSSRDHPWERLSVLIPCRRWMELAMLRRLMALELRALSSLLSRS